MSTELVIRALISGIFFVLWPLFMNQSGLNYISAAFAFILVQLFVLIPVFIKNFNPHIINIWSLCAGVCGAVGMLFFTGGLEKIPKESKAVLSTYLTLMLLIQVCVIAVHQIVFNGINLRKILGFVLAGVVVFLLLKS